MAEFVPRDQLVALIKRIFLRQESCVVTVVTEQEHNVVIGFSDGRLTRLTSRGQDTAQIVAWIRESNTLKFGVTGTVSDGEPDLMPVSDFLDLLDGRITEVPTPRSDDTIPAYPATEAPVTVDIDLPPVQAPVAAPAPSPVQGNQEIARILHDLAVEHIGPITDMVVEQAMHGSTRIEQIVTEVANNIPDRDIAANFRREASARIRALINNQT